MIKNSQSIRITKYAINLAERLGKLRDPDIYSIFRTITIDEIIQILHLNILNAISHNCIDEMVHALQDNPNFSIFMTEISLNDSCNPFYNYRHILMPIEIYKSDPLYNTYFSLENITLDDIKDYMYLDHTAIANHGLFSNPHLSLIDLAKLFYEFANINKSSFKAIKEYKFNVNLEQIANIICERYDLTTELVKECFKPEHYIYFIKHPAIDPFKLYNGMKLPINEMLGNPSLSYEVLCKYIPLASDLSYLVTNKFEEDNTYKKVKLYREKQQAIIVKLDDMYRIYPSISSIILEYFGI